MRVLALALLLAACGSKPPKGPCEVVGSGAPAIVTFVQKGPGGSLEELKDGGALWLSRPAQGGQVAFVGAAVKGLCPTSIEVTGVLSDDSGEVGSYHRADRFWIDHGDGTIGPEDPLYDTANVPVCPLTRPLAGAAHLDLSLKDAAGRTAKGTLAVVPTCMDSGGTSASDCDCECGFPGCVE